MLALSIRQPWAELILRGVKTIEYRSRPTRIIGQRFYIYVSKGSGFGLQARASDPRPEALGPRPCSGRIWSRDLSLPSRKDAPPAWMLELAELLILGDLPTGVIVGSAVIEKVTIGDDRYHWHLAAVQRSGRCRKPKNHPQPVWFRPF